jgi:phosphomevalonate kinase
MRIASAPGKSILCGEYAVLAGAPAVVAAIDLRACGWIAPAAPAPAADTGPLLRCVVREVRTALERLGHQPPVGVPVVDTTALVRPDGPKLGLGSSAATAVCATAALLDASGIDPVTTEGRHLTFTVADAAHRAAQHGIGSGADVAAAVHGGLFRFRRDHCGEGRLEVRPLPVPLGLTLQFFWTSRAAPTSVLLEAVVGGAALASALERLSTIAFAFAAACSAGDTRAMLTAMAEYGAAMRKLGQDAGVPIVTPEHERLMALAAAHGGAAKPSGAGGGDVAVALVPDPDRARALAEEARRANLHPLALAIEPHGLRLEDRA